MAFNIEYIIKMVDEFSGVAKGVRAAMVGIQEQTEVLGKKFHHMERELKFMSRVMIESFTAPILAATGFAIKASIDMDDLKGSLENAGVSGNSLGGIMKNLQNIADNGIGNISSLGEASRALLEAGVRTQDLNSMMQNLGNISAASGQKIEDVAGFMAKIKSQGKLTSADLGDLQKFDLLKGFMTHEKLHGKHLDINNSKDLENFKKALAAGTISYGTLRALISDLTTKNGMFADAMQKNSKTVKGAFIGLKNAAMASLAPVGDELDKHFRIVDVMNRATVAIQNFAANFDLFTKAHPKLISFIMDLGGIMAAIGPFLLGAGLFSGVLFVIIKAFAVLLYPLRITISLLIGLSKAIRFVSLAMGFMEVATAPIMAIIMAVIAVIGVATYLFFKYKTQIMGFFAGIGEAVEKYVIDPIMAVVHFIEKAIGMAQRLDASVKNIFSSKHATSNFDAYHAMNQNFLNQQYAGMGGNPMIGMPIKPAQLTMSQHSRADVNININDKNGNVKNVETKSKGNTNFNVGTNMAGAM